ncbi:MAG: hypothetical protein GY906_25960 [bacterium]|nr:hypothetical protein [bacterium]
MQRLKWPMRALSAVPAPVFGHCHLTLFAVADAAPAFCQYSDGDKRP